MTKATPEATPPSSSDSDLQDEAIAQLETEAAQAGEYIPAGGATDDPAAPQQPTTGEIIGALLHPLFSVAAPEWKVHESECNMLGNAWGAVIDKYFPGMSIGVELNAAIITLAILGPRIAASRAAKKAAASTRVDPTPEKPADAPQAPAP